MDAQGPTFRRLVFDQSDAQERLALPAMVSPRTFACLWLILALLTACGLAVWLVRVPELAIGAGVVVDGVAESAGDEPIVALFLPPDTLAHLAVGQSVLLEPDSGDEPLASRIVAVETRISSPDAAQRRFRLNADAALAVTQPSAVALARFEPESAALPGSAYLGTVYEARVVVGSRSIASIFPGSGRRTRDE